MACGAGPLELIYHPEQDKLALKKLIMAGIENLIEELLLKKGEVDSGVRSIYLLFVAR